MIAAFVSYSHRDETFRNELEVHLAMLRREGVISLWHDRRITAGSDIDSSISKEIRSAGIILLLVSPYFLDSDYCYNEELAIALERHKSHEAVVIPIIVNPCDWKRAPFGKLRATPADGRPITKFPNPHDAYQEIVGDIRAAISTIDPEMKPDKDIDVPRPDFSLRPAEPRTRTSNLRLKREFSQLDLDKFLDGSFEYIANFFETSLEELATRNPDIENRYRRIDLNHFSASIYRRGEKLGSCRVWIGSSYGQGIYYASSDSTADNGYNECLSVTDDGQMLLLRPSMGALRSLMSESDLSQTGAAEFLWNALISPLQ